jgi:hypothetical protein
VEALQGRAETLTSYNATLQEELADCKEAAAQRDQDELIMANLRMDLDESYQENNQLREEVSKLQELVKVLQEKGKKDATPETPETPPDAETSSPKLIHRVELLGVNTPLEICFLYVRCFAARNRCRQSAVCRIWDSTHNQNLLF